MTTSDVKRFWSRVNKSSDCWEWAWGKFKSGYGQFRVEGKAKRAHRVAWEIRYGKVPKGLCVLHRCDNPACVRPGHLFLGTHRENMEDKANKGRAPKRVGERHPMAKLTTNQVKKIRREYAKGNTSFRKLAVVYGVYNTMISQIVNRQNWKHIK